jgi:hypothetical protein
VSDDQVIDFGHRRRKHDSISSQCVDEIGLFAGPERRFVHLADRGSVAGRLEAEDRGERVHHGSADPSK